MVGIHKNAMRMPSKPAAVRALPSRCGSTQNIYANIKVVVRVRPPNAKELALNNRNVVDVVDDKMLVFDPKEDLEPFFYQGVQQKNKNFLKRANKEMKFVFDSVFGREASNEDVFRGTTSEIIKALMDGFNCSVFVYGATGAGKTFTMIGNKDSPGITYLTMDHLFATINSYEKERDFNIAVSYLEVYNESVFDLLKQPKKPLNVREDAKYGVVVAGLTLPNIKTAQELLQMLESGNKNRTQHPTDANAESSRSHAVFQVYVKMRYKTSGECRVVKLSMIDLAGSERASATGCVGERFKEGANINRSLLALGNCINKLADGSKFIPYRDSKLTRLLKDSLGGNCRTIMIANISPSSMSYEDTYNTLKYAARANKIQLSITKNIVDADVHVSQYVKMIEELQKEVKELKAKLSLSSIKQEPEYNSGKSKQWRQRLEDEEKSFSVTETRLLNLMTQHRIMTLNYRWKQRALINMSSMVSDIHDNTIDLYQVSNENIPRQERAAENFPRHSINLQQQIQDSWKIWKNKKTQMHTNFKEALKECPDLKDLIDYFKEKSELRFSTATANLNKRLYLIEHEEAVSRINFEKRMAMLLNQYYRILHGSDRTTPAMTQEYCDVLKLAKCSRSVSWQDEGMELSCDGVDKYLTNLNINDKPDILSSAFLTSLEYQASESPLAKELSDTDNTTDNENDRPLRKRRNTPINSPIVDIASSDDNDRPITKHKTTPVKLPRLNFVSPTVKKERHSGEGEITSPKHRTPVKTNNDTIIIDDSISDFDSTRTVIPSPGRRKNRNIDNIENSCEKSIDPSDLNSTFVLAATKIENAKKQLKADSQKKFLTDRTNTMHKTVNFSEKSKLVKPLVGRAAAFRRPLNPSPLPAQTPVRGAAFGSNVPRNGIPVPRNVQAVRARDRVQTHPYSRPALGTKR